MEALFLKGALLGFSMAAPIGPVGILTIRTSIARGRTQGQFMALAVATADALYGAVAAFGLTIISDPILYYKSHIQFFGGFLLLALAIQIKVSKTSTKQKALKEKSNFRIYTTTLFLALSNPSNIFSFAAAFTAFNLATKSTTALDASLITAGVFFGAGAWFSVLAWLGSRYRHSINERVMKRMNLAAAVFLGLFACYAIYLGYVGLFAATQTG